MTESGEQRITPMMKQFFELKEQYSDCILLFRAGDFYETFYEDAKVCAQVLGITLTKRSEVPMAGVPYHSITPYIRKFVQNNYKVAICEQLEDPKQAKGLVKRGVTRIITPGTILEDEYLSSAENNFIMGIYVPKDISQRYGTAIVDITTGEFLTSQLDSLDDLKTVIRKYTPNEVVLNESTFPRGLKDFLKNNNIYYNYLSDVRFHKYYAEEVLKRQFGHKSDEMGLEGKEYAIIASGALLFYIHKLQKLDLSHINKINYVNMHTCMVLDSISLRNLEISESFLSKDRKKTLFGILNNTKTAAGSRLLKQHLVAPLLETKHIEDRLDAVEECNELVFERNEIRELLDEFSDVERITSRIASGLATPRDLMALKLSLQRIPKIKEQLFGFQSRLMKDIKRMDTLEDVAELIEQAIVDDPPVHTREIGYLRKEYHQELRELADITFNSKDFIRELEETERLQTGIQSLKIRYNKVFGYYIEVPRTQVEKVPEGYETKQTLVNAIRYIKPELREKENMILNAEEKMRNLEKELYDELVNKLRHYIRKFQQISQQMALLDVFTTHSINAQMYGYVRPGFSDDETYIVEGRNPIVEHFTTDFTPNETDFSSEQSIKIITGPNMSGKSTYLRQNALLAIMAQCGSFLPAKQATMKIYDRVFTRIGAHDELAEGQSTFMVEMSETANILNNASGNSLVLLDEIGRGTSTYDGLAIAWSVIEELVRIGADTVFATHYHQLNALAEYYPQIENYNVSVREEGEQIEFIHKIVKGGTDKSYGIYVGKLAGIPETVLERAKEVQHNIEEKEEIRIKPEFRESIERRAAKNSKRSGKRDDKSKGLAEFFSSGYQDS